jgi:hypothetical protein
MEYVRVVLPSSAVTVILMELPPTLRSMEAEAELDAAAAPLMLTLALLSAAAALMLMLLTVFSTLAL